MQGHFYNQQGQRIVVTIGSVGGEIGGDGLYFADNPVEITSQVSDSFDVRLCQQATIRLLTKGYLGGLFSANFREVPVTISRDGATLFSGFVEPQTYSQPFNEDLDEIELSCIDKLIALEYAKYGGVGGSRSYGSVKSEARQRTFGSILSDILASVGGSVSFDSSVMLADGSKSVWDGLTISEALFYGDGEDDVWTLADVVDEMLRFLNLHIIQDGDGFRIFSWQGMPQGSTVAISTKNVYDCGTTISVDEVFSRMKLTCDVKAMETVVDNPVDEDLIAKHYDMYQKYMTEYAADGEGEAAITAFDAMTHGMPTDYGAGSVTDWFVQVLRNPAWRFPTHGSSDILSYLGSDGKTDQHKVADWLATHRGAALLAFGKVKQNTAGKDNAPVNKVELTNYLCLAVNGNGSEKMAQETDYHPNTADLEASIPYAVYTGGTASGNFAPADDQTKNYIVISGSIILNPLMGMTDSYEHIRDYSKYGLGKDEFLGIRQWWHITPPSRNNSDGRYYTRRYYRAATPHSAVEDNPDTPTTSDTVDGYALGGFTPFTDEGPQWYQFKYSAVGDSGDKVSKVGVVQCMLVIGGKCVVEKPKGQSLGTGVPGTGNGQPSDYVWMDYKTMDECRAATATEDAAKDMYYQQSFAVGIDPKIDDYLIGTEFDIQNNIDYTMNVDAKGTAIPIPHGSGVSGDVEFTILGPVNAVFGEVTRRHPTCFRHTRWTETDRPLMARVSNIMLKEFKIGVYSDNGLTNNRKDCDIVYLSDTDERTVNDKELTFRISSALTTAECSRLGVTDAPRLSTPIDTSTDSGVTKISVGGTVAKAEQHYVSEYYDEWHTPHVLMEQSMQDTGSLVSPWNTYTHPAMAGKTFRVQGIDRNLGEGSARLHLKEI